MTSSGARHDSFIDVLKGVGIVLVYWGHSAYWGTLVSRMIFCFHMPLFFFVSGVLFKPERIESVSCLWRRIWRSLLIPYLLFCYVGFVLRVDVIFRYWQADPLRELIRMVHGEGSNAIWFLMCLASIQVVAWLTWRFAGILRTRVCGALAMIVLTAGAQCVSDCRSVQVLDRIPFMLASVPCGMIFFGLGFMARNRVLAWGCGRAPLLRQIALFSAAAGLFAYLCSHTTGTLDLRVACFHLRHLPSCLLGIGCACLAARMIAGSGRLKCVFAWLGKYSLCMFALELPISHVMAKMTGAGFLERLYLTRHASAAEVARVLILLGIVSLCARPMMTLIDKTRAFFCDGEGKGCAS